MAKPNKHRRALNRLNRTRTQLTAIHADLSDERIGLIGYENYYEITRKGEVFSRRLNRFIKHKFNDYYDKYSTYIEFQIHGQKMQFGIGKAVAESYLTQEQILSISKQLPEEIDNLKDLWGLNIIDLLARKYNVISNAIFYIFKNEFNRRQLL